MGTASTSQTRPQRLARVLAVLAAVALMASACGEADPAARIAQAAEATTADETARFTVESELTGVDLAGGDLSMSGEGEIDFTAERTRLTTRVGAEPFDLETEILIEEAAGVSYVRLPEELGGKWLRLGMDRASVEAMGQISDPGALLRWLEELATDIEEVGEDSVRGQSATRYRMTLDHVGALEEIDDDATRDILARQMTAMGLAEVPADVWVDEQGRVVRFSQEIDLGVADPAAMRELLAEQFDGFDGLEAPTETAAESLGLDGIQTVTMEFHDFGADVDVELPSDEDVIDVDELGFGL